MSSNTDTQPSTPSIEQELTKLVKETLAIPGAEVKATENVAEGKLMTYEIFIPRRPDNITPSPVRALFQLLKDPQYGVIPHVEDLAKRAMRSGTETPKTYFTVEKRTSMGSMDVTKSDLVLARLHYLNQEPDVTKERYGRFHALAEEQAQSETGQVRSQ
jgi:hypothetical protein